MHLLLHFLIRPIAPYFDRAHLLIKLLVATAICAGGTAWVMYQSVGVHDTHFRPAVIAGGVVGLLIGLGLAATELRLFKAPRKRNQRPGWRFWVVAAAILWLALPLLVVIVVALTSGH